MRAHTNTSKLVPSQLSPQNGKKSHLWFQKNKKLSEIGKVFLNNLVNTDLQQKIYLIMLKVKKILQKPEIN